jgi:acyl-CoA thioester hydrolase
MKIAIPEKKKKVYEMEMAIRWGDLDAMGHLNNTSYFRYFETARIDWLYTLGQVPGPATWPKQRRLWILTTRVVVSRISG